MGQKQIFRKYQLLWFVWHCFVGLSVEEWEWPIVKLGRRVPKMEQICHNIRQPLDDQKYILSNS